MGYNTDFDGQVTIDPPLSEKEVAFINAFADERHEDATMPGIWCQWIADDLDFIEWDGNEKFYDAAEWMKYIIDNFIGKDPIAKRGNPDLNFLQGHVCNGEIEAQGEEAEDRWKIVVEDGVVTIKTGEFVYDDIRTLV